MALQPTLAIMAEIYRLDRTGGPGSPRFKVYRARVEATPGLAHYNPMAGPAALATVERLLALDAEAIAAHHAARAELAIVVSSPGMWTDRVATELDARTSRESGSPAPVRFWAGEAVEALDVEREAAAASIRFIWGVDVGSARTLHDVLAREGRAYADHADHFGRPEPGEVELVADAVELLGESENRADIAAVLLGDPAARALGFTPLGLPENAGYRYAIGNADAAH